MTDALVEAVARDMLLWQHGNCVPWDGWHICVRDEFRDRATAALQAIEAAGYRVVPVEATEGQERMRKALEFLRDNYSTADVYGVAKKALGGKLTWAEENGWGDEG